jgi:hypothetical protein
MSKKPFKNINAQAALVVPMRNALKKPTMGLAVVGIVPGL